MAGTFDPGEFLKPSPEKTNYMILSRLVHLCGTKIFREVLNHYGIPKLLADSRVKQRLIQLRKEKRLSDADWRNLYPSRGSHGKIESFDITLMFKLLRNFSRLPAPRTGWDNLPDDGDATMSADAVRIKYYRNKLSHDNENMEVEDEEFNDISSRIKNALVRMLRKCNLPKTGTAAVWENAIDCLLNGHGFEKEDVLFYQRIKNGGRQLKMFLQGYYGSGKRILLLPLPSMEGDRFLIKNFYTHLKITAKDDYELIEMKHLFSQSSRNLTKCRRLLIEGEPGVGKSSFCKKIAYAWSRNKALVFESSPKFELVLLLQCGKLSYDHEDIWSAIEKEILPKDICSQKEAIWAYIQDQQDKVLLILDGFDEIPAALGSKTRKAVLDIMDGKMLPGCSLIVTSRTDKEPDIHNHFDKVLKIRGFEWKDSCDAIRRFYRSSPNKAREAISWIRKKEDLKELVANPLYTAFTCLIFQDEQEDMHDLFCFLQKIVFCVAERYSVERQDQQVSDDTLMDGFHFEHLGLGKLALDVIEGGVDCFEEKDFARSFPQTLKDLGFLSHKKEMNRIRPKSWVNFSHSCIRRYFAEFFKIESFR